MLILLSCQRIFLAGFLLLFGQPSGGGCWEAVGGQWVRDCGSHGRPGPPAPAPGDTDSM